MGWGGRRWVSPATCAHWRSRDVLFLPQPRAKLRPWWMALCVKQKEGKGEAAPGSFPRTVLRVLREHSATRNQLAKHQLSAVPMVTTVTIIIRTHRNSTGHALPASGQALRGRTEGLWKEQKLKYIKRTWGKIYSFLPWIFDRRRVDPLLWKAVTGEQRDN